MVKNRKIQALGIEPDVFLSELDAKVIAENKEDDKFVREKDLRNHLTATIETPEEKKMRLAEEKQARARRAKAIANSKNKKQGKAEEDLFHKYEPKEDYQVLQAVNYLKSFQVYKHFQSASR